jgi:hypothetical protein
MLTVEDLQAEDDAAGGDNDQLAQPELPIVEEEPEVVVPAIQPGVATVPFYLNPTRQRLAHDVAQFWEGCQSAQLVEGGYESDSTCSKAYFQPKFAAHLNRHFLSCAKAAAARAGIAQPARLFIRHWGSYNDRAARGSTRLSMHAYARALDIVNFNLYDATGKLTRISTHVRNYSGSTAVFYDEFRACWKASIPSSCRSGDTESSGSIGFPGSKAGGNTLHNDHLHLSFPLCAG